MYFLTLRYLPKRGEPLGSVLTMTTNAYMKDEVWRAQDLYLYKGIQEMPVIRDHPDWWVTMTLDGFESHIDVNKLEVFTEFNIVVCKEEGYTLQVNQQYDQSVAKYDKLMIRKLLDSVRGPLHVVLGQYQLMGI